MHASLADLIVELFQNAREADATRIELHIAEAGDRMIIDVSDNGSGMSAALAARVFDPHCTDGRKHPRRSAGLGLPFLKQTADATGGHVRIETTPGQGCRIIATFGRHHVDLPPLGNLAGALTELLAFEGDYELTINREKDGQQYSISSQALREALGEIHSVKALELARQYIASRETALTPKLRTEDC